MKDYDIVLGARGENRPTAVDYINVIVNDFMEFHGDRYFGDDGAVIAGVGFLKDMPITVIGIEKGKNTEDRIAHNFGSAHPEGYRKALRLMKQAEKFHRPVLCFVDTAGAFCGVDAEERGQGRAIAENLYEMSDLKTPILSIVIGEGGSGGALALSHSDKIWMLEDLMIEDQAFSDLKSMPACGLETLVIWDCGITSLQGVGQLPYLRELIVRGCPLRDVGDLQYCLELRKLGLPHSNIRNISAVHSLVKLAEVELSGFSLNELRPVLRQGTLSDVTLQDCDLRGRFFYRFDSERSVVSLSLVDCELNSTKNLEDFTGLTTLTLIRSGENLDWSELAALPCLKAVYCDSAMADTLQAALQGSGVSVRTVD